MLAGVERARQPLGDLGPGTRRPAGERVRQPEHGRAHDLGGRVGAGADQVVGKQGAVESADLLGRHGNLLPRPDSGRHPVDGVAALEHALDERPRLAHPLDGVGRRARPRRLRARRHDLVDREASPVEDDGSSTPDLGGRLGDRRELRPLVLDARANCPRTEVEKPHWGERASRSSGTTRAASRIRPASSATVSRLGVFVVTRPSTQTASSWACASGSKPPERASSYSSRSRCARTGGRGARRASRSRPRRASGSPGSRGRGGSRRSRRDDRRSPRCRARCRGRASARPASRGSRRTPGSPRRGGAGSAGRRAGCRWRRARRAPSTSSRRISATSSRNASSVG